MAKKKCSIALRAELAQETRRLAGPRGLSRLVNAALEQYLQAARLRHLETGLSAEHGATAEEVRLREAAIRWPN
jgi:hypothetical protein